MRLGKAFDGSVRPGISRTQSRMAAWVISVALLLPLLLIIAPATASSEQAITRTAPYDYGQPEGTLVGAAVPCVTITYSIPPFPSLHCRYDPGTEAGIEAGINVDVKERSAITLSASIRNAALVDPPNNMEACFRLRTPNFQRGFGYLTCTEVPPIGQLKVMTTEFENTVWGRDGFEPGKYGFSVHLGDWYYRWEHVSGPNVVSVESISVRLAPVGSDPAPKPDTTPPTRPTALTAQAVKGHKINLDWNASTDTGSGLAGYRIERSSQGSSFTEIAMTTATSYTDTGLKRGTTYTYRVVACDKAGNCGPASDPATAEAA